MPGGSPPSALDTIAATKGTMAVQVRWMQPLSADDICAHLNAYGWVAGSAYLGNRAISWRNQLASCWIQLSLNTVVGQNDYYHTEFYVGENISSAMVSSVKSKLPAG